MVEQHIQTNITDSLVPGLDFRGGVLRRVRQELKARQMARRGGGPVLAGSQAAALSLG